MRTEDYGELVRPLCLKFLALCLFLLNEAVYDVGINPCKACLLQLPFQHSDQWCIELTVHEQDVVALLFGSVDVGVLSIRVVGIEIDELAVFVCLLVLDEGLVFVEGVVFAFGVFEEEVSLCLVEVVFFGQESIMDENLDVVPLLFKVLALVLEDRGQAVAHLLCDVTAYLLDVCVALQITPADIQRDVGRVDDAMQKCQELGHDAFYSVGHEDLVAIELNLVALDVEVVLYLREVEDASQVEGVIDVEVNPEERLVGHREEVTVELLVVLVLEVGGLLCPQRLYIIYYVILVGINLLAVLPLGLFAESDGHGQEVTVLAKQSFQLVLFEELEAVIVEVHHNVCASLSLLHFFQSERRTSVATPFHGRRVLIALCDDIDLLAHHERRVEAQAEVADDGVCVILVLVEEVVGSRESNLVDVLLDFVSRHADTVIANGNGFGVFIDADTNLQVAHLTLEVAFACKGLELLSGIDSITDDFANKYFVVAIEKLFDDGEDILGCNPDVTLFHIYLTILQYHNLTITILAYDGF